MTISSNGGRTRSVATGGETEIDFDFLLFEDGDIQVLETDTDGVTSELVLGVDYTVPSDSISVPTGGVIDLDSGVYPSGATAGHIFTCLSAVPANRQSDFQTGGDLRADTINDQLDRIVVVQQQNRRDVDRSLRLLDSSGFATEPRMEDPEDGNVMYWSDLDGIFKNGPSVTDIDTAAASALAAATSADEAEGFATAAEASAEDAAQGAVTAAAALVATSVTSVAIGTGTKTFTIQTGKAFGPGQTVLIASDAAPTTNYMTGVITSYAGGTLSVSVPAGGTGGSGTYTDWTIYLSGSIGATGATGATGPTGSGAGDMLKSANLSDVASASTSRTNLGLGTMATQAASNVSITGGTIKTTSDLTVEKSTPLIKLHDTAGGSHYFKFGVSAGQFVIQQTDNSDVEELTPVTIDTGAEALHLKSSASSLGGSKILVNSDIDTDVTLAGNSDTKVASQKAIKTYVDGKSTSGKLLGYDYAVTTALDSTTTVIPWDDTIPQNTEGDEALTLTYTPTRNDSILIVRCGALIGGVAGYGNAIALFKDFESSARAVAAQNAYQSTALCNPHIAYRMVSGTTSPITFRLRYGANNVGTCYLNGGTGRKYGGVANTFIEIEEIAP